jgi:hypothetical protein
MWIGPRRHAFALIVILAVTLACSATAPQPTATAFVPPTVTPSPTPPPTATPSPLPPTRVAAPPPAWVTEVADPFLAALAGIPPAYQDDFSGHNLGWFYVQRGSADGPFYAPLEDGSLLLRIPTGREYRDFFVYNPYLRRVDFVLTFDFKFGKTQPFDVLRFQFNQSADQSVQFDLSKHEDWSFDWSLRGPRQSVSGAYQYFSPEFIRVTVIMRGRECAFYVNDDPLGYLNQCRADAVVEKSPRAVSFHLLSATGQDALATLDHVTLWDLKKTTGLR